MLLTREQILAAVDIQHEDVEVPEWGGTVRVVGLSGADRDAFEQAITERKGKRVNVNMANIRAKLVSRSLVGEDGILLFQESDIEALGKKSAAALDRVFSVAQRLSGLSDADVEELAGNSEDGQSDDSTSD